MERIRSGEEIRKKRERHLRRMLTAVVRQGRKAIAASRLLESRQVQGLRLDLPVVVGLLHLEEGIPLWEPERIDDPRLRDVACDYMEEERKLEGLIQYCPIDGPFDYPGAAALRERLEELQRQMSLRMDELNWPEVDE